MESTPPTPPTEEEEVSSPIVFQCNKCHLVVGASLAFHCTNLDIGSTYINFKCSGCEVSTSIQLHTGIYHNVWYIPIRHHHVYIFHSTIYYSWYYMHMRQPSASHTAVWFSTLRFSFQCVLNIVCIEPSWKILLDNIEWPWQFEGSFYFWSEECIQLWVRKGSTRQASCWTTARHWDCKRYLGDGRIDRRSSHWNKCRNPKG